MERQPIPMNLARGWTLPRLDGGTGSDQYTSEDGLPAKATPSGHAT